MKVLVFTTLYPNSVWPNHGVFIKERISRLVGLDGCEVKVIAPVPYFPAVKFNWRWKYSQVAHREWRDGIEVHHPRYFITPKIGMALYGWMMFVTVLAAVKKVQKNFDFDLIDAHFVYPDGFAAIQLGRIFKKPVVVSARGSDINLYKTFAGISKLLQYVLSKADRVIAVSQALKRAMVDLGIAEGKIFPIPNGVDLEKFYPVPKERARQQLGLSNGRMILSVGNLTPNKGFDLLIRSFAILIDRLDEPELQLTIVGEGLFRSKLEKLIATLNLHGRARLVGALPHNQLRLWYSAADLFCLVSHREGWPNVILESLACGTPVVATPAGGIPEILNSETLGLLTERDERKIADAIVAALGKKWISDQLVAHARNHSWNRAAADVLGVFQSALDSRKLPAAFATATQSDAI